MFRGGKFGGEREPFPAPPEHREGFFSIIHAKQAERPMIDNIGFWP